MVAFEYNRQSKKDDAKSRKDSAYKQMEETRYREQLEVSPPSREQGFGDHAYARGLLCRPQVLHGHQSG